MVTSQKHANRSDDITFGKEKDSQICDLSANYIIPPGLHCSLDMFLSRNLSVARRFAGKAWKPHPRHSPIERSGNHIRLPSLWPQSPDLQDIPSPNEVVIYTK